MRKIGIALLLLGCLGACVPAAFATDGVMLINQATLSTGLPGCAPVADVALTVCRSGSYRLSGNIVAPFGAAVIEITAAGVSLDLNGFTVSGSTSDGIRVDQGHAIVSNGSVQGRFGDAGIVLHGDGNLISSVSVTGISYSIDVRGGSTEIRDCIITDTPLGVRAMVDPVTFAPSHVNLLNSTITGAYDALVVTPGFGSLIGYGGNLFAANSFDGTAGAISHGDNVCSNGTRC